jgi:SAM-dependent methyltransferase
MGSSFAPAATLAPRAAATAPASWFSEPILGDATRFCVERMGDISGKTVLDLACGRGEPALCLAERGARVIALDMNSSYIAAAARAARDVPWGRSVHFITGSAEALPLEDRSVDIVFCRSALQYMDLDRVTPHVLRALRRGGELHLVHNLPGNPLMRVLRMVRPFTSTGPEEDAYLSSIRGYASPAWLRAAFSRFAVMEERYFHLFRILTLAVRSTTRSSIPICWLDTQVAALDSRVLERFPGSGRWAWIGAFVFRGLDSTPGEASESARSSQ